MTTPQLLATRFPRADGIRRYRTIIRATGEVGTGKTRFGLTGPEPLLYQSLDKGLEGIIEEFVEVGKTIYVRDYNWHPGTEGFSQEYASQLRDEFIVDYEFALEHGARLIVWDKETDVWEMFRYAEFGRPNDAPKDYAKLNQRYIALVNRVKNYEASLVLIQAMKDEWGQSGPISGTTGKRTLMKSGVRIPTGYGRIDEIVFVELHFRREAGEFYLDVGKCRQNSALQDQTLSSSDMPSGVITFADFGQLLMPGSAEADWL